MHIVVNPAENSETRLFAGTLQHVLDDNHRVTVPSRWRHEGLSEFFALPDPRQSFLILLPASELQRMATELEAIEEYSRAQQRQYIRQLFARATSCMLDRQGRLVLPAEICQDLGLHGEVVLAGGGARIEVWQPDNWQRNARDEESTFAEIADRVGL
jgi:MraZ protein